MKEETQIKFVIAAFICILVLGLLQLVNMPTIPSFVIGGLVVGCWIDWLCEYKEK